MKHERHTDEWFWSKVRKTEGCWIWTYNLITSGYGQPAMNGKRVMAHRYAYEQLVGLIPEGMVLDHTCHNQDLSCPGGSNCPHRACVNPQHLDVVTFAENCRNGRVGAHWRVKTHCPYGHPYSGENLRVRNGRRECLACIRRRYQEKRTRKLADQPPIPRTHCKRGHEFTIENTIRKSAGGRQCRECARQSRAGRRLADEPKGSK